MVDLGANVGLTGDPEHFDRPALKTRFKKQKSPQSVACSPVVGRYVLIKCLSEVNNGPWASAAKIGIIGDKSR